MKMFLVSKASIHNKQLPLEIQTYQKILSIGKLEL
mgnify:CR=1 FL=1